MSTKAATDSPSRSVVTRAAPPLPGVRPTQNANAAQPMGTPPPLPKRQANANKPQNDPAPAIPARANAPPLPARPSQM